VPRMIELSGTVFSGMGKGRYYVGHPEFQSRFLSVLGYNPFPGTLNVRLAGRGDVARRRKLRVTEGESIPRFVYLGENFSAVKCFNGEMGGQRMTLVIPEITEYDDTVAELIAPVSLRKALGLRDGIYVTFTVNPVLIPWVDGHRDLGTV
jgi:riboflavin kinase